MSHQNREGYDQTRDPRTGRPPLLADAERMKTERANQPQDGAPDPGMSLEKKGEFQVSANHEIPEDPSREEADAPGRKEDIDASLNSQDVDQGTPFPNSDVDGSRSDP